MLTLHPLLRDHAILACDHLLVIQGTAAPGATVQVSLSGESRSAIAGKGGDWVINFPPLAAGDTADMEVVCDGETLAVSGLTGGRVFLLGGQSNMEWLISQLPEPERHEGIEADPDLRFFAVKRQGAAEPLAHTDGVWREITAESVGDCSAIGYHFARILRRELKCPVGLVACAVGGSPAAAWLSLDQLAGDPQFAPVLARARKALPLLTESPQLGAEPVFHKDPGNAGFARGLADPATDDSAWPRITLPGMWQRQGFLFNGAVWLRHTMKIPTEWFKKELILETGVVDDFDDTYFNGVRVGGIGSENPNAYSVARSYRVPAELVCGGRAVIAIRVFDHFGEGGINGTAPLRIRLADDRVGEAAIPLAGTWHLQVELALHSSASPDIGIPVQFYNGMLHPLRGAAFDGILWYQGESDEADGAGYRHLLHAVVRQWRSLFGEGTPFFVVQLAGFREPPAEPGESWWAELRESQATVLDLPRTALVAAHDLGEADDIHPRRKREVAERLAAAALHGFFGHLDIPASGPCFEALEPAESGCLRVRFRHANGLRTRDGQAPGGFQIAAAARNWQWADARIDGESVLVSHPGIPNPVAVRYAWADNPAMGNLENADGWPAFPFRTDTWPLSSGGI